MSLLIRGGEKVDKYYSKQLLKYFCRALESGKYPNEVVIEAAIKALEKISKEDKEFTRTFIEALMKKYPDTLEFQKLVV